MYGVGGDLEGSQGKTAFRWLVIWWVAVGFGGWVGDAAWVRAQEGRAEGASSAEPMRFEASTIAMGTRFSVIGYATDETTARQATQAAFDRVRELDDILSDYDATSEASLLGDRAGGEEFVEVSATLADVLRRSVEWHGVTEGAFDVTIGPLSRLWRQARRNKQLPSAEAIEEACRSVGSELIEVQADADRVRLRRAGVRLDFGGIGQGYAADEMLRIFDEHGIGRVLIDASGDVLCGDPPPGKEGWEVAVAPLEQGGAPQFSLIVKRRSVSTSGDAFQFLELEGKRYSHLINPKTGWPVEGRSSVTVLARDATAADALASAMSVMGPEKALALAEKLEGVEVLIVVAESDGVAVHRSSGWDQASGG